MRARAPSFLLVSTIVCHSCAWCCVWQERAVKAGLAAQLGCSERQVQVRVASLPLLPLSLTAPAAVTALLSLTPSPLSRATVTTRDPLASPTRTLPAQLKLTATIFRWFGWAINIQAAL